jgi:hypothetical protein
MSAQPNSSVVVVDLNFFAAFGNREAEAGVAARSLMDAGCMTVCSPLVFCKSGSGILREIVSIDMACDYDTCPTGDNIDNFNWLNAVSCDHIRWVHPYSAKAMAEFGGEEDPFQITKHYWGWPSLQYMKKAARFVMLHWSNSAWALLPESIQNILRVHNLTPDRDTAKAWKKLPCIEGYEVPKIECPFGHAASEALGGWYAAVREDYELEDCHKPFPSKVGGYIENP